MPAHLDKKILEAILAGTHTPAQLRDFLELCYALAVPPIRKRIASGRLNPQVLGLSERDIVQDSIADLFIPNHEHKFSRITGYVMKLHPLMDEASEAELTRTLRQLIVGKVNNEIVRLLGEADSALADILRNIHLGIERTNLFYKMDWFNEKYIVPRDVDMLRQCPPMPDEMLEQSILQSASRKDNVPQLLRKLHIAMSEQSCWRRMAPVVPVALVFRKVITTSDIDFVQAPDDIGRGASAANLTYLVDRAIHTVHEEARRTYVRTRKCTEEECTRYVNITRTIFLDQVHPDGGSDESFFEITQKFFPGETREEYRARHKTIVEYLVRLAKAELSGLRDELE